MTHGRSPSSTRCHSLTRPTPSSTTVLALSSGASAGGSRPSKPNGADGVRGRSGATIASAIRDGDPRRALQRLWPTKDRDGTLAARDPDPLKTTRPDRHPRPTRDRQDSPTSDDVDPLLVRRRSGHELSAVACDHAGRGAEVRPPAGRAGDVAGVVDRRGRIAGAINATVSTSGPGTNASRAATRPLAPGVGGAVGRQVRSRIDAAHPSSALRPTSRARLRFGWIGGICETSAGLARDYRGQFSISVGAKAGA
jgi:hypothetical protein